MRKSSRSFHFLATSACITCASVMFDELCTVKLLCSIISSLSAEGIATVRVDSFVSCLLMYCTGGKAKETVLRTSQMFRLAQHASKWLRKAARKR